MRTGVYYKATGGVHGVDPKFFGNPRPPGSRNAGSPPETSSLETLPSSRESRANQTNEPLPARNRREMTMRRFTLKVGLRKACQQGTLLMMSAGLYSIVQGLGNVLGTPAGISGATKYA